MRKPALTKSMQIGIVGRNLDAAIRKCEDDHGIGPWATHPFKRCEVKAWREHGRPAQPSTSFATAMIGKVRWEPIQPLGENRITARFLPEKGEGIHHIAIAAPNHDELLSAGARRGNDLVLDCEMCGRFEGIKGAYLGTQRDPGVLLEVFNGLPGGRPKPNNGGAVPG